MNKQAIKNEEPSKPFDLFLLDLRAQEKTAWGWLLDHFREKVVPYIRKKDGRLPKDAVVAEGYFIEEVFANSLIKFYELFESGTFENMGQLRSMMFRIAEFKLKEAYRQLKKDQILLFTAPPTAVKNKQQEKKEWGDDQEQQQVVWQLEAALKELPETDREVLVRYTRGERLKAIATELNLNEVNCRKKKQRALEKLRKLLKPLMNKKSL